MNQTLLVLSRDKKKYEKFVRDFGMRVLNIQYVYADSLPAVEGWDKNSTFYTILGTAKHGDALDFCRKKYKHVPFKNLEAELKERKQLKRVPTQ